MRVLIFVFLVAMSQVLKAQDELMDLLGEENNDPGFVSSTFKSTRLINGHTIETRTQGVLEFVISHRFGTLNSGFENFWGLDVAQIRLGLEYGITDDFNVGIGRSSFNKVYDFFGKYKVLKQSNKMPFTVTLFGSVARRTDKLFDDNVGPLYKNNHRMAYTYQAHIARKFNNKLSLQVSPTLVHRNFVFTRAEPNDLIAIGTGGRYKITNRVTLNMEYYPMLNQGNSTYHDALAIGVDIETGGHVFQLHLTNAQQINERGFIGETTGNFFDGDIHFGFNISRVFNVAVK